MTISNIVDCKVLGITDSTGKDGTKYYKLSIMLNDMQAGMISVAEPVVKLFHDGVISPLEDVQLECVYNDAYGSYKAMRIFKPERETKK